MDQPPVGAVYQSPRPGSKAEGVHLCQPGPSHPTKINATGRRRSHTEAMTRPASDPAADQPPIPAPALTVAAHPPGHRQQGPGKHPTAEPEGVVAHDTAGLSAADRGGLPAGHRHAAACGCGLDVPLALGATLLAVMAHALGNVINDLHDARNGADAANTQGVFPFTGGSRLIQNGTVTEQHTAELAKALAGVADTGRAADGGTDRARHLAPRCRRAAAGLGLFGAALAS